MLRGFIRVSKVLITGCNGFIGSSLSQYLQHSYDIVGTCRFNQSQKKLPAHIVVGEINAHTDWQQALNNVHSVVHLAARVHVMQENHKDPLSAFSQVNTSGSINLAKQAAAAGVRRFIYLSTIKVNGEATQETPFYADDQPDPQDAYAQSKFEAEQQLLALVREVGLEVVIIRPPLVYGAQVKGNLDRLVNWVDKSWPLPLAGINNARSLVSIENLCSLIECVLSHPKAKGETFLVSDGEDVSTPKLIVLIAQARQKKNNVFYLNSNWLQKIMKLLGLTAEYQRLSSSLQVSIEKNKDLLNWQPEVSTHSGIINAMRKTELHK